MSEPRPIKEIFPEVIEELIRREQEPLIPLPTPPGDES